MTAQARVTLKRDIRTALNQMRKDIPPIQFWTAAAERAAEDRFIDTVTAAAEACAQALAQPTLFDASEVAS